MEDTSLGGEPGGDALAVGSKVMGMGMDTQTLTAPSETQG